uniref:SRR1-like domain-containing protein n=1 Tax=Parascaris univalens TaxID=6257 RepID=A0A915BIA5_PARUN
MIFSLSLVLSIIASLSITIQLSFVGGDRQSTSTPIEVKRSYARCFGTSRFLFVGFANSHLTIERSPPPRMCPYHALYQASTYSLSEWNCPRVQMHLLTAIDEEPRVLIIGANRNFGYMVAHIKAITWPEDNPSGSYHFHKEPIDMESARYHVDDILYANVITTIFDNHYRLLYVLRNSSYMSAFPMECVIYLIDVTVGGEVNFTRIGAFEVHSNNDRRTLWTEDPYAQKVYYAERSIHDERILVYSVQFHQLMRVLTDGDTGSLERILIGTRVYLSVSKGIAISYSNADDVVRQYIHRIGDTSEVILCEHKSIRSYLDPTAQLIILFDDDYCKVKENKGEVRNCEEELSTTTIASLNDKEKTESSSDINIFWFLPIVIVLCAIILVLIICIVRHRREDGLRSFLKADRPHVQYYPTFISDSSVDF